ncbi:MAG: class I SAM-dependent methyltransferase [Acidimicrobiia bacterium]|nr:class I SAM-dependent methyltransferase [Acidimicrobiia bacterium]
MSLEDLQRNWNGLAQQDAFRAVLTSGGHVPWDAETFFRTGVEEIGSIMARLKTLGISTGAQRALDFGCGLGRLTQALARHFDRVDGVDISENMLTQARGLNPFGDRLAFHLNSRDDLALFPDGTFDLVYSNITLQHMEPRYSVRYIREFFRVAKHGGAVVFQLPGEPVELAQPTPRHTCTRSTAILPDSTLRAHIEPHPPVRCAPGALLLMNVTVRNMSTEVWPAEGNEDGTYSVRLGNHWRSRFGRMLKRDDVRAQLTRDVRPGESLQLLLRLDAPWKPGVYQLEFDMVQENVKWFAAAGSRTRRTRVQVDRKMPVGQVEGMPPQMEMFGIPRRDVEALIDEAGGRLRAAIENDAPGPAWTSFWYISTR